MSNLKAFNVFILELFFRRRLIFELAKRDFQSKYLGSYLGIIWAFAHPSVYIVILWFVFQIGFKSRPEANHPFVLWMLTGIIPWFFFSDCLSSATNSVLDHSFLLKKMVISASMLPIVKILSALVMHFFFICVVFVMFLVYGYSPSVYNLQVIYYLFASIVLLLGLSWLTSSLIVFLRDVGQIVAMILQFAFWITPIFWSAKILPPKYLNLLKLNPVYYLVEGYREAFIYKAWFWQQHYVLTLYFWAFTGCVFFVGAIVFRRLRPHFADVI